MKPNVKAVVSMFHRLRIESYADYVATLESALKRHQDEFISKIDSYTEGLTESEANDVAQRWEDEAIHLHHTVPTLMWQNAFVTICSLFEHELLSVCQNEHARRNGAAPLKPVLPKYWFKLEDAVDYLKREKVPFPGRGNAWREIGEYREIRNFIVHYDGRLVTRDWLERAVVDAAPDCDQKGDAERVLARSERVRKYVERRVRARKVGIELSGDVIQMTPDFCREALRTIGTFFDELVAGLP